LDRHWEHQKKLKKLHRYTQNINQWITNKRESDFLVLAWFLFNHGSSERDILSHKQFKMAWLHKKMAWFQFLLVWLLKFWTPFALIFAKCHDLKQGYFQPFQVL
jgi:hypothetical protein